MNRIDQECDAALRRWYADRAQVRRSSLRQAKRCINGAHHPEPTHGCRCDWCWDVHTRGLPAVLESPRFERPIWRRR